MILVIDTNNKNNFRDELNGLHRLRKRVFHDLLGWNVPIVGDCEIDEYDDLDPVYILSVDEQTRAVRGGVRLMPTTGPHLMKDVFSTWFEDPLILESATVWEATRFCVDPAYQRGPYTPRGMNLATAELISGIWTLASEIGLSQLTAICHMGMINALKRAKCPYELVGRATAPAGGQVFLGLCDVSAEIAENLRLSTGIESLETEKLQQLRAA